MRCYLYVAALFLAFSASAEAQSTWQLNYTSGPWHVGCSTTGRLTVFRGCNIAAEIPYGRSEHYRVTVSADRTILSGLPKFLMAHMRVDASPVATCSSDGMICVSYAKLLKSQIANGSMMLIDVMSINGTRELNLPLQGFRDCLRKITEWGYSDATY